MLPTDGTPLNTSLTPANATQAYAFDATAGESIYLVGSANYYYFQSIYLRLIDPAGNVIMGPTAIGTMLLTTPVNGRYTLLVEGERDNAYYSGATGFSLALTAVADPAPVAITLGQAISGQIAAGSEKSLHIYSGNRRQRHLQQLYQRPDRATGADRRQRHDQDLEPGQRRRLPEWQSGDDPGGRHLHAAVTGTTSIATPVYGFGFYDMSTEATLTAGTAVTAKLQPNQAVAAYTIALTAGTQLRIYTTRDDAGYNDQI